MLREIQCVGWSLLDPEPVALQGPVSVLMGQNGSCKSSFMDAVKALLGARRFGSNRTPTSYRFTGRAGSPARKRAYVSGLFEDKYGLGYTNGFTVTMEVGASKRLFLVREGDHLTRVREQIPAEIEKLRQIPRSAWLSPGEYQERILERMGIGPSSRRFLELPQGELSRVLDKDNVKLTQLMLELASGKEASEDFERASKALEEASKAQIEAERSVEKGRARLAELSLAVRDAADAEALRGTLSRLLASAEKILAENPEQKTAPSYLLSKKKVKDLGLIEEDGLWVIPASAAELAKAHLGPGESIPVQGSDRSFLVAGPRIEGVTADLPERTRKRLQAMIELLRDAGISPGEPSEDEPAEVTGAIAALTASGIPDAPGHVPDLQPLQIRLAADQADLEEKTAVLSGAVEELARAREIYFTAAEKALRQCADRFSVLCDEAGMAGRMEILKTPQGVSVQISVAEEKDGEMRPLAGSRNSLSGGWRATVIVFAVISCLGRKPSMLLIDEVGSSLDEERLGVLGHAFRKLGERTGTFTMITIPSKTMSQTVGAFASQQIAFFRPLATEPMAPPPHVIQRALRAAS